MDFTVNEKIILRELLKIRKMNSDCPELGINATDLAKQFNLDIDDLKIILGKFDDLKIIDSQMQYDNTHLTNYGAILVQNI